MLKPALSNPKMDSRVRGNDVWGRVVRLHHHMLDSAYTYKRNGTKRVKAE
jgi:hypothetical protein